MPRDSVQRHTSAVFKRHTSALVIGAAALVVALVTGAVREYGGAAGGVSARAGDSRDGDVIAASRERVDIGDDVVAVLDPGARIVWHEEGAGLRLEQRAGRVLYRVKTRADVRAAGAHASCSERCAFVIDADLGGVTALDGPVALRTGDAGAHERTAAGRAGMRRDDDNALASLDDDGPEALRNLAAALTAMQTLKAQLMDGARKETAAQNMAAQNMAAQKVAAQNVAAQNMAAQ